MKRRGPWGGVLLLEASLKTLTPREKFDLYIAQEPSGRAEGPTGPRVLQAAVR